MNVNIWNQRIFSFPREIKGSIQYEPYSIQAQLIYLAHVCAQVNFEGLQGRWFHTLSEQSLPQLDPTHDEKSFSWDLSRIS